MMATQDVGVFAKSATSYIEQIGGSAPEIGIPYLSEDKEMMILNYTGAIGISGPVKGAIYVTADIPFLKELYRKMFGSDPENDNLLGDIIAEMVNTIAGNAQAVFGEQYMISLPLVFRNVQGISQINMHEPTYVIPIRWQTHNIFLVMGVERTTK
ncbi:MAG: chemotaxis protein CheX [Turneriella sp.]|nr:chemotaxis protein CheX [Turneriella sp.]